MFASIARRLRVLAPVVAGAAFIASVAAAPAAVDAAGLLAPTQPAVMATPNFAFKPDLQVTPQGVHVDANGNVYYKFTIKNIGMGLAKNVKVIKLYQVKEVAYPQKLKNTVTVLEYSAIPAGQEKPMTILCEKSLLYTCIYGSVEVKVENPETTTANNYASQTN